MNERCTQCGRRGMSEVYCIENDLSGQQEAEAIRQLKIAHECGDVLYKENQRLSAEVARLKKQIGQGCHCAILDGKDCYWCEQALKGEE